MAHHRSTLLFASLLSRCFAALVIVIIAFSCPVVVAEKSKADTELVQRRFTLKVLPVLKSKCFACHGEKPKDVKGEFDIRSLKSIQKGGKSGSLRWFPGIRRKV